MHEPETTGAQERMIEPNKSVRTGIPRGARLLHVYNAGARLSDGKIATGKEPNEKRGHLDAVPVDMFFDNGGNIGIALDGQYIVVDFDTRGATVDKEKAKLPATWRQQTWRGEHHLFRVPDGWKGRNVPYTASDATGRQAKIGDIKSRGYIVGPGSARHVTTETGEEAVFVYTVADDRDPEPAPQWLLDLAAEREDFSIIIDGEAVERDRIEDGNNDAELTKIAGFLRHRGFAQGAIATMLSGIINSGILEQDESRGLYSEADAKRIARSASKWAPGEQAPEILVKPESLVFASDIALVRPPKEWWLHRFVPKGELTLLYGEGGIGKSSWVSWLAALVTKAGGLFVHVGVEESFEQFALRAVQHGADRTKLCSLPAGASLTFPKGVSALSDLLETVKASFIYFDSIYTHFDREKGSNSAERARAALGPLAEMAQRINVSVFGTFHENKAGDYLGSVEMRNVCRCLLRASRRPGKPLRIAVDKTNHGEPDYVWEFPGVETTCQDPETGEVQREVLDDGAIVPMTVVLPGDPVKVNRSTVSVAEIDASERDEKVKQARALYKQGDKPKAIAEKLKIGISTVYRYISDEDDDE